MTIVEGSPAEESRGATPGPVSRAQVLEALGAALLPSLVAAAVAGLVIAGAGGRLAMFALRMTSGDHVVGTESDDGFIIGRVTASTLGLIAALTVGATAIVGPLWALMREWMPRRWRVAMLALWFGVVGGALLVHREGVDFTVLSPRWLAVALFVAIPVAFGAALEPLRSRAERWVSRAPRRVLIAVPVAASAVALAGPPGLVLAVAGWAVVLMRQGPRAAGLLRSPGVAWAGRALLLLTGTLAAVDLARDVEALLL